MSGNVVQKCLEDMQVTLLYRTLLLEFFYSFSIGPSVDRVKKNM